MNEGLITFGRVKILKFTELVESNEKVVIWQQTDINKILIG